VNIFVKFHYMLEHPKALSTNLCSKNLRDITMDNQQEISPIYGKSSETVYTRSLWIPEESSETICEISKLI